MTIMYRTVILHVTYRVNNRTVALPLLMRYPPPRTQMHGVPSPSSIPHRPFTVVSSPSSLHHCPSPYSPSNARARPSPSRVAKRGYVRVTQFSRRTTHAHLRQSHRSACESAPPSSCPPLRPPRTCARTADGRRKNENKNKR